MHVAVDDPMHCCPRPSASGNSASGHPQHLMGDSFDCCTERYEIVVYCDILSETRQHEQRQLSPKYTRN